jgi:3-oxoacyl-[acyl-carrier protein] reductase
MQGAAVFEGSLAYGTAKAALIHGARVLARDFGGRTGINVNVVAPGVTSVGMARASVDSGKYDPMIDRGVIARFGRPEDVARAVRLLIDPDAYISGQVLVVDGGLTLRRDT